MTHSPIPITTRLGKGSPLKFEEMDDNLTQLKSSTEEALNTLDTTVSQTLNTLVSDVSRISRDVDLVDKKAITLNSDLLNAVTTINASITNLTNSTQSSTTNLSQQLVTVNQEIANLKSVDTATQSSIVGLTANLSQVGTTVGNLSSSVSGLSARVTSLEGSSDASEISKLKIDVVAVNTRVDALALEVAGAKSSVASFNTALSALTAVDATKADKTYADTTVAGKSIDVGSRVNESVVVFDLSNNRYYHKTIAAVQSSVISDVDLLKTDVATLRNDVNTLRTDKANKNTVDALILTVGQKADSALMTTELAKKEQKDCIAGKLVDTVSRADSGIPVYDAATDKYIHKTLSAVQGTLASDVDALKLNKADLTYVDTQLANKAALAHGHTAGDISGLPAPPDVNKAYVDTQLATKATVAFVNGEVSTLVGLLDAKEDTADVTTKLAAKANVAHTHQASDITGLTMTTPGRFIYVSPATDIVSGQSVDLVVDLPNIRLYGVHVGVQGIPAGQKLNVELYGDSGKTTRQYFAEFTDILTNDTAQAWMYRNLDGDLKMYLRIMNSSMVSYTGILVTIIAEPF